MLNANKMAYLTVVEQVDRNRFWEYTHFEHLNMFL